ncbi:ATP-dependent helicase-like protein [Lactobacillus helveticus H9]|nr:ATP-dependent helicase-like protein [Lactobacillus helveticus H9]
MFPETRHFSAGVVHSKEVPGIDKYDQYLPKELLRKEFAYSVLDIQEMKRCVKQMANTIWYNGNILKRKENINA